MLEIRVKYYIVTITWKKQCKFDLKIAHVI